MRTVCVYHSIDLDGWMSAAIVKHWFFQKTPDPKMTGIDMDKYAAKPDVESAGGWSVLDFYGYNYGQPIPDLSEYDRVIMCDISFPKEEMLNLWATKGLNFDWIDHHISAINEMDNAHENISYGAYPIIGLRDTKFAACELTWKYFFPKEEMPEIVRLLGRYDCFGHKGTEEEIKVLEFQYGARQEITNYKQAFDWLVCDEYIHLNGGVESPVEFIWKKGVAIYAYLCTEATQSYKNGSQLWLSYTYTGNQIKALTPFKFICINKERFNPINFGIDYHADGYDGAACFHRRSDGKWSFSLYNDNGNVDCSVIAKQFGGGGHKGASGFVVNDINEILK